MPPSSTPGYSFAPTFDQAEERRSGGAATPQQALEVLSFRLKPRIAGAPQPGGLSPLQGSQQAGSSIASAVLQSVLRTVLGAGAEQFMGGNDMGPMAAYGPGLASPAATPNPVIHPGTGGGQGRREPAPEPTDEPTPTDDIPIATTRDYPRDFPTDGVRESAPQFERPGSRFRKDIRSGEALL